MKNRFMLWKQRKILKGLRVDRTSRCMYNNIYMYGLQIVNSRAALIVCRRRARVRYWFLVTQSVSTWSPATNKEALLTNSNR